MSKVKILYIDNTYTFGGAIISLANLVNGLDRKRYEVTLVSGQAIDYLKEHFHNCPVYSLREKKESPFLLKCRRWLSERKQHMPRIISFFLENLIFLSTLIFIEAVYGLKLFFIALKVRPDIVHLNNMVCCHYTELLLFSALRKKIVCHIRAYEGNYFLTRFFARFIHRFIVISKYVGDSIQKIQIDDARISIVYDSLNLELFRQTANIPDDKVDTMLLPYKNKLKLGIIGRVIPWKGQREFLSAFFIFIKKNPLVDVVAFIIGDKSDGDNSYFDELQALVEKEHMTNRVIFTGYIKQIARMMDHLDIVVHASIEPEPFGMVIIEGMALKKAVIAANKGGGAEIITDGKDGYLVSSKDIDAMAEKIILLAKSSELCKKIGEDARITVERRFSAEIHVQAVTALYEEVLSP